MNTTDFVAYTSCLLIFFIVALASRQIGKWFAVLKLPLITGFLFAGILAGPFILNIVPAIAVSKLKFIDDVALAFIAFSAGSELVVRQIKNRLKTIRYVTIGLVLSTFCVSSAGFYLLSEIIPVIN
ncbi:MAG: cation:proton antiporter, partial [Deltaproteobacteria bacterium]|nr:cation:proton antiporter [Deltaproteobacteria bacterium]